MAVQAGRKLGRDLPQRHRGHRAEKPSADLARIRVNLELRGWALDRLLRRRFWGNRDCGRQSTAMSGCATNGKSPLQKAGATTTGATTIMPGRRQDRL